MKYKSPSDEFSLFSAASLDGRALPSPDVSEAASATRRHDSRLDFLASQNFPFLAFGRSESGGEHAWIDRDIAAFAEEAVDRLAGFGHERIAVIMPGQDAMQAHIYLKSFRQALKRHGIAFDSSLVKYGEFSERGGYHATEALLALKSGPTAYLFQSDSMAIGAYRRFHEAGLVPGEDVAVTSGLLTGEMSAYPSPALTGFTITPRELGVRMAEAALAQIPGNSTYFGAAPTQVIWLWSGQAMRIRMSRQRDNLRHASIATTSILIPSERPTLNMLRADSSTGLVRRVTRRLVALFVLPRP
ncbi:substrate-binding domain-containing protein [Pararobbsia alpina]|uniref:HTH-type transcriptional repressor PurR n=1 Tax=Pararobbsia alpina TaxID=621374 RepID=A0A6S7BWG5_9BURK|nr:substrate-binding domain-containing protein [Pararobbsia alpina]CAB3805847.1 HTH-type transcriptional repressor PurR [Pararobbsia alpina]